MDGPLSAAALTWAWDELLARAGAGGVAGLAALELAPVYGAPADGALAIRPCEPASWTLLATRAPGTLAWRARGELAPPGGPQDAEPLPLALAPADVLAGAPAFAAHGRGLAVSVDLLALTALSLGRWEERARPAADAHDRYPATASLAFRQGFLDRPVVDEWAQLLGRWIAHVRPGWRPAARPFSVHLSHDVDHLARFRGLAGLKSAAADLIKRRSPRLALETLGDWARQLADPAAGADVAALRRLAELDRAHGFTATFYWPAAGRAPLEATYDLAEPWVAALARELAAGGFELGLHPGYASAAEPARLAVEKARLAPLAGERIGARQHFLRFRVPDTWWHLERAGIAYDATLGFADHEGFRAGTARPYRTFDLWQDRPLALREVPLAAMDTTLVHHRRLTPEEGRARLSGLAARCRAVGGTCAVLWHNITLTGATREWGAVYEGFLAEMRELGAVAYAPLSES